MRYLVPFLFAFNCVSCATASRSVPLAIQVPDQRGPIITRLVSRNSVIVVRAGIFGPTYALQSKAAETLTPDMTLSQLAVKNPELFHKVKSMQDNLLWAGTE